MHPGVRLVVGSAVFLWWFFGCGSPRAAKSPPERDDRRLTIAQIESLRSLEEVLPIPPDSVAQRFQQFDRATFYATYGRALAEMSRLIDSLNSFLPKGHRVDTLSIDHTIEGFAEAASMGKTMYVSSSYFYLFPGTTVLRSVVFHEFGHIHARMMDSSSRAELVHIWTSIQAAALFYLFRDGEYSGNARFGGHPEESPDELFASGFNLFHNRPAEISVRRRFVDDRHRPLIDRFLRFIQRTTL